MQYFLSLFCYSADIGKRVFQKTKTEEDNHEKEQSENGEHRCNRNSACRCACGQYRLRVAQIHDYVVDGRQPESHADRQQGRGQRGNSVCRGRDRAESQNGRGAGERGHRSFAQRKRRFAACIGCEGQPVRLCLNRSDLRRHGQRLRRHLRECGCRQGP